MWGRNSNDQNSEYTPVLSNALKDAIGRRGSRARSSPASLSICMMRSLRASNCSTTRSIFCSNEIPAGVELFDRGISRGDTPRLWIDAVSHVVMGRDKRHYRFVMDGRYGRKMLAESTEIPDIVDAVTRYVAGRLIERERALTDHSIPLPGKAQRGLRDLRSHMRWRLTRMFIFGLIMGCLALFVALWIVAWRSS